MGKRIAVSLLFAALSALLVWCVAVFGWKMYKSEVLSEWESPFDDSSEEVLFDDDSTVDWSDPVTDVFDSSEEPIPLPSAPKTYEFALTPQYFNALLERYSDGIPIRGLSSSFASGNVILSGMADVDALTELLDIPAALVIFLPDTVDCKLACVPRVEEGRLRVSVVKVWAGSDILAPFLSTEGILSSVEDFLNDLLMRYLPEEYQMQSATVTDGGLYVRFSIESEE